MNLLGSMVLLLFFFRAQFGEPAESYLPTKGSWHTGEPSQNFINQIFSFHAIPCPERSSSFRKAGMKSLTPLLCKWQDHQLQLWQKMRPVRSKEISVPQEPLLVERKKNLSTYNWNSFGLRYGKRQVMNTKME